MSETGTGSGGGEPVATSDWGAISPSLKMVVSTIASHQGRDHPHTYAHKE